VRSAALFARSKDVSLLALFNGVAATALLRAGGAFVCRGFPFAAAVVRDVRLVVVDFRVAPRAEPERRDVAMV
jgi:hypothetical protein